MRGVPRHLLTTTSRGFRERHERHRRHHNGDRARWLLTRDRVRPPRVLLPAASAEAATFTQGEPNQLWRFEGRVFLERENRRRVHRE